VELSGGAGPLVRHGSPEGGQLGPLGVAVPEENAQFPGRACHAGRGGGGPPLKVPVGEAFCAEPKALAIVGQEVEGRAGAVAKDVDGPAQRVLAQRLAAQRREAVTAFAAVDGRHGEKDTALRRELQQQRTPKKGWSSGTSAGAAP